MSLAGVNQYGQELLCRQGVTDRQMDRQIDTAVDNTHADLGLRSKDHPHKVYFGENVLAN